MKCDACGEEIEVCIGVLVKDGNDTVVRHYCFACDSKHFTEEGDPDNGKL